MSTEPYRTREDGKNDETSKKVNIVDARKAENLEWRRKWVRLTVLLLSTLAIGGHYTHPEAVAKVAPDSAQTLRSTTESTEAVRTMVRKMVEDYKTYGIQITSPLSRNEKTALEITLENSKKAGRGPG